MWDLIETANGWIVRPKQDPHAAWTFRDAYVFTTHAALAKWIKENTSPAHKQ
jgi:hypothetical protein